MELKNVAEQALGDWLAFATEGRKISYNAVITWAQPMKDKDGKMIERDPFAQVKPVAVGTLTGYYVSCNVGVASDWREAFSLAGAKLIARTMAGKRGPVAEETKEEFRKKLAEFIPPTVKVNGKEKPNPKAEEIGQSVGFLIAVAKDKAPANTVRLTLKLKDGMLLKALSVFASNLGTLENLCKLAEGGSIEQHIPGQDKTIPFDLDAHKAFLASTGKKAAEVVPVTVEIPVESVPVENVA